MRSSTDGKDDKEQTLWESLRVTWLALPWSAAVTSTAVGVALYYQEEGGDSSIRLGYILHGVAAMLELASEPLYVAAQQQLLFGLRAAVEAAATLARSGVSLWLLLSGGWPPALVFSLAQLAFGGVTLLGYAGWAVFVAFRGQTRKQKAAPSKPWGALEQKKLRLTGWFTVQAGGKLIVSEAARGVVAKVGSATDQGVYGLVSNLGSLVVRVLLLPIEETAFITFARQQVSRSDSKALGRLGVVLGALVRTTSLLGLVAVTFGPPYARVLLFILYGRTWINTEAPLVLALYTAYILVLAVNGVTEAFVHAVQDVNTLRLSNAMLILTSSAHIALTYMLAMLLGTPGLVLSDAVNMVTRIGYSLWYIRSYFSTADSFSLSQLAPSQKALSLCLAAACGAWASDRLFMPAEGSAITLKQAGAHVGMGALFAALLLFSLYKVEGTAIRSAIAQRKPQKTHTS